MGSSSFTLSSIGTGGIFSPPAVIINSETKKVGETEHTVTDKGEFLFYIVFYRDRGNILSPGCDYQL